MFGFGKKEVKGGSPLDPKEIPPGHIQLTTTSCAISGKHIIADCTDGTLPKSGKVELFTYAAQAKFMHMDWADQRAPYVKNVNSVYTELLKRCDSDPVMLRIADKASKGSLTHNDRVEWQEQLSRNTINCIIPVTMISRYRFYRDKLEPNLNKLTGRTDNSCMPQSLTCAALMQAAEFHYLKDKADEYNVVVGKKGGAKQYTRHAFIISREGDYVCDGACHTFGKLIDTKTGATATFNDFRTKATEYKLASANGKPDIYSLDREPLSMSVAQNIAQGVPADKSSKGMKPAFSEISTAMPNMFAGPGADQQPKPSVAAKHNHEIPKAIAVAKLETQPKPVVVEKPQPHAKPAVTEKHAPVKKAHDPHDKELAKITAGVPTFSYVSPEDWGKGLKSGHAHLPKAAPRIAANKGQGY